MPIPPIQIPAIKEPRSKLFDKPVVAHATHGVIVGLIIALCLIGVTVYIGLRYPMLIADLFAPPKVGEVRLDPYITAIIPTSQTSALGTPEKPLSRYSLSKKSFLLAAHIEQAPINTDLTIRWMHGKTLLAEATGTVLEVGNTWMPFKFESSAIVPGVYRFDVLRNHLRITSLLIEFVP